MLWKAMADCHIELHHGYGCQPLQQGLYQRLCSTVLHSAISQRRIPLARMSG